MGILCGLRRGIIVKAIVPTEDRELLGDAQLCPVAYRWTQETVSIPIYPTLQDEKIERILLEVKR